jgi:two-component system, NtrC family, nitrogen regulation sensor histidine kinase NtrY
MLIKEIGKSLQTGRWLFLLVLICLFLAILCERNYSTRRYDASDVEKFNQVLHQKQDKSESALREIKHKISATDKANVFSGIIHEFVPGFNEEGIYFFLYHKDSLILWSSNSVSIPERPGEMPSARFFQLHNKWFLKDSLVFNEYTVFAFILIKNDYAYENRVLQGGFQDKFNLSPDVRIYYPGVDSLNAVYSQSGEFLFSLDFDHARKDKMSVLVTCIILYILAFFLCLSFLRNLVRNAPPDYKNYIFFLAVLLLMLIYYLLHNYRLPFIIFNLELFSPGKFARSSAVPSLGDLSLQVISVFFIIYNFYLEVYFNTEKLRKYRIFRYGLGFALCFFILLLFFIKTFLVRSLILDSSIAFETYKVLELSIYTFFGFTLIALLFISYSLLVDKLLGLFAKLGKTRAAFFFLLFINISAFALYFVPGSGIYIESPVFFLIVTVLIYYIRVIRKRMYFFSTFVAFILLFSVYTVIEVVRLTEIKAKGDMRIFAVNISSEHDPVAELLFVELSRRIKEDNEIRDLLFQPRIDFTSIYNEIQRKYFSGYLNKFDLQLTLCRPDDYVYLSPPEDAWHHCYEFFDEVIMTDAYQVANTEFYYLDNLNGRISYFSAITFIEKGKEMTVFIELDSRLLSEGLGYPELLLEQRFISNSNKKYSYAKYNRGKLITSSGTYSYMMTSDGYTEGIEGFEILERGGSQHVIYNMDSVNTIIVTKPSIQFIDVMITFSYIFGFYFFILVIILGLTGISPLFYRVQWNFKNKVQFVMSVVLFFSLLLIGSGTVYYSIVQYKNKHNDNLKEKLQSVYLELIHQLEFEKDISTWSSENYYDLQSLLQHLSNVFYTDINLFDKNGRLLATSRPEIFEKGLTGNLMNAVAYSEMDHNRRSEFVHNEQIGELSYLSAYVPFVNSGNMLLAYLNLPYFTRQDELTTEITNLVVAILNIFVLLTLLTLTLAVFMANTITQPLRLIQEHISRFRLSESNEKINYRTNDEIGSLVKEYNQMIDQLEESAERLARSERETAWREMAKQIAHEIKNPLTPMQLIVQHLQRSLNEGENTRSQIEKISGTLLEQIDNLSKIATEFSNFAKMPAAQNKKLNIVHIVQNVIRLFSNTDTVDFSLITGDKDEYFVWADKSKFPGFLLILLRMLFSLFQKVIK